jgi:hypothetical protein
MRRRVATNRVAALSTAILVALIALTISGVIAATASATESRSLTSSADAQILEHAPTKNYGAATSLGVNGNVPSGSAKDEFALVKWDLSGIVPRTQINSALVTLNVTTASPQTYQAYVLKKPWVESAATWNVYSSGKPWEVAGAKGSLDKEATVAGSITPSVKGKNTLTLPLAVVQDWVDNPATNQGIIIANPSSTRGFNFNSREVTDPARRPQLTLDLSLDTTPPETTIDSGPSGTISSGDVSFTFSSSEAGSTFECQLDGEPFSACVSSKPYTALATGDHIFSVRARDAAGNADATPASHSFTVAPADTSVEVPPPDIDGDTVPDSSDNCPGTAAGVQVDATGCPLPTTTDPFPGIRDYPVMGVYKGDAKGFSSDPTLLQSQYETYVGTHENAYLDLGDGDNERYWFAGGRKLAWSDVLVDESLVPASRAQAQDPNWSNYKWNQQDVLKEMLDNSTAAQQDKALLQLFFAITATSAKDPVPTWVEQDPRGLTWTDGEQKVHLRLDKDPAWQAASDFLVAAVKHYGGDPRIASMTIGEYYQNEDAGGLPADIDQAAFKTNIKNIWTNVIGAAPRDANGERINVLQSMPITSGGYVTKTDVENIGVGITGSVAHIFATDTLDSFRKSLYGVVPMQHQVNCSGIGDQVTYDGTPNPFGFANGDTHPVKYEEVVWYYDSKGVVPLDSMYMGDCSTLVPQWHEAYDQFGPNGSLVGQYGQIPNYP